MFFIMYKPVNKFVLQNSSKRVKKNWPFESARAAKLSSAMWLFGVINADYF